MVTSSAGYSKFKLKYHQLIPGGNVTDSVSVYNHALAGLETVHLSVPYIPFSCVPRLIPSLTVYSYDSCQCAKGEPPGEVPLSSQYTSQSTASLLVLLI